MAAMILQAPREATPLPHPLGHRRRPIVLHRKPRSRRGYKNHRVVDRRPNDSPVPRRRRRRRRGGDLFSNFLSGALYAFAPFSPAWSLMDQMLESSFAGERGRDAGEDENALYLRMEMPRLGKEDVRVTVEQNTLVIIKGGESGRGGRRGGEGAEEVQQLDRSAAEFA